jgi:sugar phosphate isomerase/epimerase
MRTAVVLLQCSMAAATRYALKCKRLHYSGLSAFWLTEGFSCMATRPDHVLSDPKSGIRSHIGLQLFTVRALLLQDFQGTLKNVATMGFSQVEMFGFGSAMFIPDPLFGLEPRALKSFLNDLGITVPTIQYSASAKDIPQVCATAKELGSKCIILGMAEEFLERGPTGPVVSAAKSAAQMRRLAEHLNEIGALCRRNGIGFAYHNHHMEFASWAGEGGYDILLTQTDPSLVQMELDVGWAKVAGADGADYLTRYPGRFIACHFKDFDVTRPRFEPSARAPIPEMTQLVAPGDGNLDFAAVLRLMDANGIAHGYIEIDLADDPLQASRRGLQYLANLKY